MASDKRLNQMRTAKQTYRVRHLSLGLCYTCPLPVKSGKTYCEKHLLSMQVRYRKTNNKRNKLIQDTRRQVLESLGLMCECCNEREYAFLTVEHKNQTGKFHRQQIKDTLSQYRDILNQGSPKDKFGVLCMNCNWATRRGEICPHKIKVFK